MHTRNSGWICSFQGRRSIHHPLRRSERRILADTERIALVTGLFDSYVSLDVAYIEDWSLWLDFKNVLRTIGVVFAGTGFWN